MFSTVLEEITGYLDRRFVLVLLFPSLLFWGSLLAMFSWSVGVGNALSAWLKQDTALQVVQIVAGIAWVVFFAFLLDNHLVVVTRFYEGYWDKFLPGLGKFLRDLRKKHYQKVIEREDQETIYYSYPPSKYSKTYLEFVMPTRLGNILRNAELYPRERYNIDAVLMWPRLLAVLPESFTDSLGSTKSSLDLMLIISFLSGVFAIISGVYLLACGGPWLLFLACFLGGLLVARLAYLSGLDAAVSYGQLIKSAFDMFKGDLLEKMGYEQPKSLDEEKKFWGNLGQFIYRNFPEDPDALRYTGNTEKSEKNSQEPFSISRIRSWILHLLQKINSWLRIT